MSTDYRELVELALEGRRLAYALEDVARRLRIELEDTALGVAAGAGVSVSSTLGPLYAELARELKTRGNSHVS